MARKKVLKNEQITQQSWFTKINSNEGKGS